MFLHLFGPRNGFPMASFATNVLLFLLLVLVVGVVPDFSFHEVSQPITIKFFTHINDNTLDQATMAIFI